MSEVPPAPIELSEPPALYSRDLAGNLRLNVNRTEPPEAKPSAEELEKKEANDKKAARIVELKQMQAGILKTMSNQAFLRTVVDTPGAGRGLSERLNLINVELRQLEGTPEST